MVRRLGGENVDAMFGWVRLGPLMGKLVRVSPTRSNGGIRFIAGCIVMDLIVAVALFALYEAAILSGSVCLFILAASVCGTFGIVMSTAQDWIQDWFSRR
jgi:hypothetical protein